ncbi:MAG: GNAT family N-acetyltransferase [Bacteroidetes bacterium]|nr:GNAT family N-acetyltransferase [Bacteroidota bacterium]
MKTEINTHDISIRTELTHGDLGYVIYRHGKIYGEEYAFGVSFETYVAEGIIEFYKAYNPAIDRVWVCEHHQTIVGFLLLMHRPNNAAQLRYFYLEPAYRGIGLGKKLMSLYMDFLVKSGYQSSYLWTTHELLSATSLYKRYGFQLSEEKESTTFGKALREQRYDLIVQANTIPAG